MPIGKRNKNVLLELSNRAAISYAFQRMEHAFEVLYFDEIQFLEGPPSAPLWGQARLKEKRFA